MLVFDIVCILIKSIVRIFTMSKLKRRSLVSEYVRHLKRMHWSGYTVLFHVARKQKRFSTKVKVLND